MANRDYRRPLAEQYDDPRENDPRMSPQADSDPLAELARLIGQTDPFSSFGRDNRAAPEPQSYHPAHPAEEENDPQPYDDERNLAPPHDDYETEAEPEPQPPSWLQSAPAWRNERPAAPAPMADDRYYAGEHAELRAEAHPERYADAADPRYDTALYGQAPESQAQPEDAGPPYAYSGHEQGYDDQYAEPEAAPERRRGGLLTVAIVAALAVLGTAGAFAYRSYSGGTKTGEPPVIRADANPTKIVPPTQSKDPSGKIITDRIGPSGERVVSREEQPVEIKDNSRPGAPRVVFPPLVPQTGTPPASQPAAQPNAMQANPVGGISDEPKRIKTVSIRPDQPDPARNAAPPAAAPQRPAAAPAAPANNAPMQLAPQRAAAPTQQQAAVTPTAPAPRATEEGGYVVQVSSQRSEADAQASYRALQSKFPGVLGSRTPLIKRADLGTKGVYYRAVVGPFASQDQAAQMCGNLKTAGGQCVVQRN